MSIRDLRGRVQSLTYTCQYGQVRTLHSSVVWSDTSSNTIYSFVTTWSITRMPARSSPTPLRTQRISTVYSAAGTAPKTDTTSRAGNTRGRPFHRLAQIAKLSLENRYPNGELKRHPDISICH